MGLYNIFDVTGSALSAQSVRLNTVASNLANADVITTSEQEAYRSRQPVFEAVMAGLEQNGMGAGSPDAANLGVKVAGIIESQAKPVKLYQPDHPMANEQGYVFKSNVNTIEEMTNMMAASRSYQNTVEVFNTSKQLLLKTINMGK